MAVSYTTIQSLGQVRFLGEIIHFFSKDALIKSAFTVSQKISISNKCCAFEFSIHQEILKPVYHDNHKNIKQQNCVQQ